MKLFEVEEAAPPEAVPPTASSKDNTSPETRNDDVFDDGDGRVILNIMNIHNLINNNTTSLSTYEKADLNTIRSYVNWWTFRTSSAMAVTNLNMLNFETKNHLLQIMLIVYIVLI